MADPTGPADLVSHLMTGGGGVGGGAIATFLALRLFGKNGSDTTHSPLTTKMDTLIEGQHDLSTEVQGLRLEVTRLNGRVEENTRHRRNLEESPPWREALVEHARILGSVDRNVEKVIHDLERRYPGE